MFGYESSDSRLVRKSMAAHSDLDASGEAKAMRILTLMTNAGLDRR